MPRRVRRFVAAVITPAIAAVIALPAPAALAACWSPPVVGAVSDPFREPACRWCPGNRGIEYATRPGQAVRAVETGRVTFAGTVAGTSYVVIEHSDGRRATYGGLTSRRHELGDVVLRGQVVGLAGGSLHFGLRVGERYVDPAPLIGQLVGRPRLVPVDGSPAPPAPPPALRCSPVSTKGLPLGANAGRRR